MSDFVDPTDPQAVEEVLTKAIAALGVDSALSQLSAVPDLDVQPARSAVLFKPSKSATVGYGERRLVLDARAAVLEHVVGGVVLARDPVSRSAIPTTLAVLVSRAVADSGASDRVSVLLTAPRDAIAVS